MAEDVDGITVNRMEKRLRSIAIPHVEFSELPFREALDILQQYSVNLSPDRKGMTFVVDLGSANGLSNLPGESVSPLDRPVSLNLENVSLSEALSATAAQVDTKYVVEPYAIKFVSISLPDRVFITKAFPIPLSLFDINPKGQPDPFTDPASAPAAEPLAPVDVKEAIEATGISFPGVATAIYEPTSGHLIVRNTEEQMEMIEGLINSLMKQADGTN